MSLRAYQNNNGDVIYVFDCDISERLPEPHNQWYKLPNNPRIIHATARYMSAEPMLDSIVTMYELDEELTREAANDRELKEYHKQIIRM